MAGLGSSRPLHLPSVEGKVGICFLQLLAPKPQPQLTHLKSTALEKGKGCSGPQNAGSLLCPHQHAELRWRRRRGLSPPILSAGLGAVQLLAVGCPLHGLEFGGKELCVPSRALKPLLARADRPPIYKAF